MMSNFESGKKEALPVVLFVSHDYYLGGAGKSLLLLIKNLKEVRPIAACVRDGCFIEECQKAGIETEVFLRKYIYTEGKLILRLLHFWEDIKWFFKFWRYVRRKEISLIHINSAVTFMIVFGLVGKLLRIPVVWHLRDIPRIYWAQRFTYFFVARLSSAIVCVSKAVRERFLAATKVKCRIEVVSNPLDINGLPVLPNIVGEKVVFGMPGQIAGWKRHKLFLAAARLVTKKRNDARFLIIGKPGHGFDYLLKELRQFVKLNELENIVEFEDWKIDMADIYERINVVVNASKEEPWGRTLIEGMALERPVIAFRSGGPIDIIEDYVDGLLVDEDSAAGLAEAMLYFLKDRSRIERMGKAARLNVIRKNDLREHVNKIEGLFFELLKR